MGLDLARVDIADAAMSFGNSAHFDELRADELCLDLRLAVFEKHGDYLAEVGVQFLERFRLRMRARSPMRDGDRQAGVCCVDGRQGSSASASRRRPSARLR
jgi:hypothetical protein